MPSGPAALFLFCLNTARITSSTSKLGADKGYVFFRFPERCSDLCRSTRGPFRNDHKKEREKLDTGAATPTFWFLQCYWPLLMALMFTLEYQLFSVQLFFINR